jgi:glycosyltransferase involved in cell wall biosynthesis
MSWPKILVFTATYAGKDYCLDKFIENCKKFTYPNFEHIFIDNTNDQGRYFIKLKRKLNPLGIKVYRTQRGNSSREALAHSQNKARELFLEGDYDYLMSLESDIFPGSNIMEALVWDNKDIVTGLYTIGEKNIKTLCLFLPWKNEKTDTMGTRMLRQEEIKDYMNNGLKQVSAGGMGCCLISRYILEKIGFTYIPGHPAHSDVFFFNDAQRLKYEVWVDTNLLCAHLNSSWDLVADR